MVGNIARDRMRLINPKSAQLGPIHLCLLEESKRKYELFLSKQDSWLETFLSNGKQYLKVRGGLTGLEMLILVLRKALA